MDKQVVRAISWLVTACLVAAAVLFTVATLLLIINVVIFLGSHIVEAVWP